MANQKTKGRANPVDAHVGMQLRLKRNLAGLSQQALAEKIGLTFQQLQKYERGVNRISASRLYELARALAVPVDFFFQGLAGLVNKSTLNSQTPGVYALTEDDTQSVVLSPTIAGKETQELIKAYYAIQDPKLRKQVLDLARTMAKAFQQNQKDKEPETA